MTTQANTAAPAPKAKRILSATKTKPKTPVTAVAKRSKAVKKVDVVKGPATTVVVKAPSVTATQRVFELLVSKAGRRETVTYAEVATVIGGDLSPRTAGAKVVVVLRKVQAFCASVGLPNLTVLVVSDKGVPGDAFWKDLNKVALKVAEKREVVAVLQKSVFDTFAKLA